MEQVRIDTAHNVSVALDVAPLGQRYGAALIDTAVQGVLSYGLIALLPARSGLSLPLLLLALASLYPLLTEALFDGRTLGKHVLGLRVARLDGQPPTLTQYALRALLKPIDQACSGIGAVVIALTPRAQRLGDLLAGTTVVRDGDRVTLEETLYRAAEREAAVTFPAVSYLTDTELEAVRRMAAALRARPGEDALYRLAAALQERVEARLDVSSGLPAAAFFETVLRDHNVLTGRL